MAAVGMGLVNLRGLCLFQSLTLAKIAVSGICTKDKIPPSEGTGIIGDEELVMSVVMVTTSPEGQELAKRPGEVVTAVSINGLEKTKKNPRKHSNNMQVSGNHQPYERNSNCSKPKNHGFNWMSIFSGLQKRKNL